ncbi:hypothetical protein ACI3LX_003537 [Candidozyma auris]
MGPKTLTTQAQGYASDINKNVDHIVPFKMRSAYRNQGRFFDRRAQHRPVQGDQPSTRRELTMVKITSAAYGVRGQKAAGQKGKKEREREREREKKEKESQAFAYFLFALAVETLPLRPQWVGS